MAEAHSAVAFQFAVTPEGLDVNFNHEVLKAVWQSALRSWKKRLGRVKNQFLNGMYPATPGSLVLVLTTMMGLSIFHIDPSFGICEKIKSWPIVESLDSPYDDGVSLLTFGFLAWLSLVYAARFTLRGLLSCTFWIHESFGRPSLRARVWFVLVRILVSRGQPRFFSFQNCLPRLTVPSLEDTLSKFLLSVRPLCDDDQYKRMERLANEFHSDLGWKLQKVLILKSWLSTNYISDWWEEYVYLRNRGPLIVNCNFYGVDNIRPPKATQAARAAMVTYSVMQFRRLIDRGELEPVLVNKTVPLCANQYERQLNTCRVPGLESDKLVHYIDSKHVAVFCAGRFYKVYVHTGDRLLSPSELEISFDKIVSGQLKEPDPTDAETKVGALTAGSRVRWAVARQMHFASGLNRDSLDAIERAVFFVVLDDEDQSYETPDAWDHYGFSMLTGNVYKRWFDKSWNLIVTKNGRVGSTIEHSWGDSPVVAHLVEYINAQEILNQPGYTDDGRCRGQPRLNPPPPIRLRFQINPDLEKIINESIAEVEPLVNDVDLHMFPYAAYGKDFIKQAKASPDSYVQMALQLANYLDLNKFSLTYEASMTRLFREGRTETTRSCTVESTAFVKAMCDPEVPAVERARLLRAAMNKHVNLFKEAMTGKGIDRHLFCLLVTSKYLGLDSPFLQEVLSEPWRLSTSQTPMRQTDWLQNHPDALWPGGGFGPVSDDGYGVSYVFGGEHQLFFHVSSKRSCPLTDSHRFGENIRRALNEIRAVLSHPDVVNSMNTSKSKSD